MADNSDQSTYCNGKTDAPADAEKIDPGTESPEGYCERPAGWGTPHAGEGRCKLHGGKSGRPATHGLYSNRRDELQERFEAAYGDDRLGTMRAEIAALKALMSDFWERIDEVDEETINAATKLQSEIRKSLDAVSKIQNRQAPTQEEVEAMMTGVGQLIDEHVPESEKPDAIEKLRGIALNGGRDRLPSGSEDG